MTVGCAGLDETALQSHPDLHTKRSRDLHTNGHLYRVTYTRCLIDTINSPDDGHMVARNMYRIEINIDEKSCASSWLFTKI